MNYRVPLPAELRQVEFVKLFFHLEIVDSANLSELVLLQLRRELLQALKAFPLRGEHGFAKEIETLLKPKLSDDPVAKKQHQKPSSALIIAPDVACSGVRSLSQNMSLPVVFVGNGIHAITSFVKLIKYLGTQGLCSGVGKFVIREIEAEDSGGGRSIIAVSDSLNDGLAPPICNFLWWLERQKQLTGVVKIEIFTPLRILSNGKPCFKADFARLFPFILRRITSMLSSHAGVELRINSSQLIASAAKIEMVENSLVWQDWRMLQCSSGSQGIGGLLGDLTITGDKMAELLWILQLGTMFNCGRGATYGAGQYRLSYC